MNEKPLCVRRHGLNVYAVKSQRPACENWYLCDMADEAFPRGRCCCIDFAVRVEAPVCRGEEPERWTCIHLNAVNAELEHARELCAAAGLQFSPNIIPIL